MSETLQNTQGGDGKVEEVFRSRFEKMLVQRFQDSQPEAEEESENIEGEFVRDVTHRLARYFPEYAAGFAEISGVLGHGPLVGDRDAIAGQLARSASKLLLSELSPRQIDERMKEVIIQERSWIFLNDLVAYEVEGPVLSLHIAPSFSRSNIEIASFIYSGAYTLGKELETNDALTGVERISADSWIVLEHKEPLQKMGWTIVREEKERGRAEAEIAKDDFLAQYGTKKK